MLAACDKLTRDIESNPDKFLRTKYGPLLTTVRERLAHLIGAQTDECVMVPNATHGVNTVLRNFEWQQGDIIVGGAYRPHLSVLYHITFVPHSYDDLWRRFADYTVHR